MANGEWMLLMLPWASSPRRTQGAYFRTNMYNKKPVVQSCGAGNTVLNRGRDASSDVGEEEHWTVYTRVR